MGKTTKSKKTSTTTDTTDNVQNVVTVTTSQVDTPDAAPPLTAKESLGAGAAGLVGGSIAAGTKVAEALIQRDVQRYQAEQTTKRTDITETNLTQRREIESDQHKVTTGMTSIVQNYATYDRPFLFMDLGAIVNEALGTSFAPNAIRVEMSPLSFFLMRAWMIGGIWGPGGVTQDNLITPTGTAISLGTKHEQMEDYLAHLTIMDNLSGHPIENAPRPPDVTTNPPLPKPPVSSKNRGSQDDEGWYLGKHAGTAYDKLIGTPAHQLQSWWDDQS